VSSTVLLIVVAVTAGAAVGAFVALAVLASARKNADADDAQRREALKGQFAEVSNGVLQSATDQFLKLAESRLATERVKADGELEAKRQAVESTVGQLAEKLKTYEDLARKMESDRAEKYGSLAEQLGKATSSTESLQKTTDRLYSVLSNSRTRGQWGERMAEDILRMVGLVENVNYTHNRAQESVATRPDFTFSLPDGHKLHMDVKFPLDNYMRMLDASSDTDKDGFKTQFLRDVRNRIKELTKRDYVNPSESTLDYVLLFIPNEQVYGFVLESHPGLIDEALGQKVVLASPFSLYAVLAVVRQSMDNFRFSEATREIIKHVGSFRKEYSNFQERLLKVGKKFSEAQELYGKLHDTSYKRLDQAMKRIERVGEAQPGIETGVNGDSA
jgi:DNA recombination protein RmuC